MNEEEVREVKKENKENKNMTPEEIKEEMEKSIRIQEICIKVQIGCMIGLLTTTVLYLIYYFLVR